MAKKIERIPKMLVGIDEVGRGPLAGPMIIGAVALLENNIVRKLFSGIRDSKKLSPTRREDWFKKILGQPQLIAVYVSVSHSMIDEKGISYAARYAVAECLKKISRASNKPASSFHVLLDGGLYAPQEYEQKTIIKGDEREPIIAAASIIAKVRRDRYMTRMHKVYPKYGFAIHKGYGTRAHIELIKKHGLSSIHRRTFCTRIV